MVQDFIFRKISEDMLFAKFFNSSIFQGAAGAVVHYMGYTPGLFIVGLFGILIMWMYGYFWITGMLLVAGGLFFLIS
jgi:hypothetical protein